MRKWNGMFVVIICLSFIFCSHAGCTSKTGKMTGKVVSSGTEIGIEDVEITAKTRVAYEEDAPYAHLEARTAANGNFAVKNILPDREYVLTYRKSGYLQTSETIRGGEAGKTKAVGNTALFPLPPKHGAYLTDNETAKFLTKVGTIFSSQPTVPPSYIPLPSLTLDESGVEHKITVPSDIKIPTITHELEEDAWNGIKGGLPILFFTDSSLPPLFSHTKETTADGNKKERQFVISCDQEWEEFPAPSSSEREKFFLIYSGKIIIGASRGLKHGIYAIRTDETDRKIFLLNIEDEKVRYLKRALSIWREEIMASFKRHNRWPSACGSFYGHNDNADSTDESKKFTSYEEANEIDEVQERVKKRLGDSGNPFAMCGERLCTYPGDRKKGEALGERGGSNGEGWVYDPKTGDFWAATASGLGEAGW